MVTVEQLYKDFGVLADAKDKAGEHEKEFKTFLEGVKGSSSEKRLASQFIARFFKYFPQLAEQAIDAQLDLCEDDDMAIRKQAIKDLPSLCKDTAKYLPRIADVLVQLLQSEDSGELSLVQTSLLCLFKIDAKGSLEGLFTQILQGEDIVRERAIKFMTTKMKTLPEETMTKEVEDYLVTESKKVLDDVTGGEFVSFMKILSAVKSMSSLQGRQQLVEIVIEQADLDKEFEPSDPDGVDRLMQCVRQVLPFYSKNVQSTKFVVYMCDHVLPVLSEVTSSEETGEDGATEKPDLQLEMLKLFAELVTHCGDLENPEEQIQKVFDKLLEYMPLPPPVEEGENSTPKEEPKLQFSYVECLMYAFHQLGRKKPEFLSGTDNAERLKDFRIRLQYFARGVQVYIKQLRVALQGKTGDILKTDENKIKVIALKITSNINILIKDLFHNPPAYKTSITLSWKPIQKAGVQGAAAISPGQKRPGITPITYDSSGEPAKKVNKHDKGAERRMYVPPSGKYSEKAGTYTPGTGRGRGRGFRGGSYGRGRGRGGNWGGGFRSGRW